MTGLFNALWQMSIHKKTLQTLSNCNLQNFELDDVQNQMLSPIVHCHSHFKTSGQFISLLSKICFADQDKFLLLIVALCALPGVTQTQWQLQVNDFHKVTFVHNFIEIFERSQIFLHSSTYSHVQFNFQSSIRTRSER